MKRRVCIVTGSRAEFGLLSPVMRAVRAHRGLELVVIAAGSHLVGNEPTVREVDARFGVDASVAMQRRGKTGRAGDALSVARGIEGCARAYQRLEPDWVVVLGDRIEAFAAASAASIAGVPLLHIHGGDRAEGIADEAMRHAISKLAHLHAAATEQSARRLRRMGEDPWRVHVTGSPAIDGLGKIAPMNDAAARRLGDPQCVLLLHPAGLGDEAEAGCARAVCAGALRALGQRVLAMSPNLDAGRGAVAAEIDRAAEAAGWTRREHLDRATFVALLQRLAGRGGLMLGNSSAGLIECAALRLPAVNVGPRQGGRERAENVIQCPVASERAIVRAIDRAMAMPRRSMEHPYGDGHAGRRIAALLATFDRSKDELLRKRCAY